MDGYARVAFEIPTLALVLGMGHLPEWTWTDELGTMVYALVHPIMNELGSSGNGFADGQGG